MTYEQADAILSNCNHERKTNELPSGRYVCTDCANAYGNAYRQIRKEYLASLPRCEFCNRRATLNAAGAMLCGHHFKIAQRKISSCGIFGMAFDANANSIRALIKGKV